VHLFAAYQGDGIGITRTYWNNITHNFVIGYPDLTGVGSGASSSALRFYVASLHPGASTVRLVLNTPDQANPRVTVYDLEGRKVKTLGDGRPVRGTQEFQWDCRDRQGSVVPTGMYFARLTGAARPMVVRVPVVH